MKNRISLDRYVERRFTAADASGGLPADFDYRFLGSFRSREPRLAELLSHPRVIVLAEPGGGKSITAYAAVLEILLRVERMPVLVELKGYRSDLSLLLRQSAPAALLKVDAFVDGVPVHRTYVLDGVDEVPTELLEKFAIDLSSLLKSDSNARFFLTARQAFYVASRALFSDIPAVFHILELTDEDIRQYVRQSHLEVTDFMEALRAADATEEVRNPFVLSVIVERFQQSGGLSDRRSENISYMIDRLIQSRPRVNQHRQRRALRMLGVAMEVYSRNELTEEEALQIVKESMPVSDAEARAVFAELYGSILRRTVNGLAFQARSFGEYLAAEALEDERLDRVEELAFLDAKRPNDSWLNAISYLAELNAAVRRLFVQQFPLWMIHPSPAVFSSEEKDTVVSKILVALETEGQYVTEHPQIQRARLARLVTPATGARLIRDLHSPSDVARGNALVLLGLQKRQEALPVALAVIEDRTLATRLRYCALIAIVNTGGPAQVDELLPLLDGPDPLETNLPDMIGGIVSESQLSVILPRILTAGVFLSTTYYHFRDLRSRIALTEVLHYVIDNPHDLNASRAEGYLEPILSLTGQYWDREIANLCVDLLETVEAHLIYPDRSGSLLKFFEVVQNVDGTGLVARLYFERSLARNAEPAHHVYFVDQIVASLIKPETARWLVERNATALIKRMAGYLRGEVREILRPDSDGVIDAQDAEARAYHEEDARERQARKTEIQALQERLFSERELLPALRDFAELSKDHWPELSAAYKAWLEEAISVQMIELDLGHTVEWRGDTLWQPNVLSLMLTVLDRYELRLRSDEPLVFAITGWATEEAVKYYRRFGFSPSAISLCEHLLKQRPSSGALQGLISFLREARLFTTSIENDLKGIVTRPLDKVHVQIDALNILIRENVADDLLIQLERAAPHDDIRERAFLALIERQHRPTIERSLSELLEDDNRLRDADVGFPMDSSLAWLARIRSEFAWKKLVTLREKTLRMGLGNLAGIVTETLANINRIETASLIRRQVPIAPQSWRAAQQARAMEQEQRARVEEAQRTPFDAVLRKLKRSTSIKRLKFICEGSTDEPVYKALLAQAPDAQDIIVDNIGGWPNLRGRDPQNLLLGCKEAILVMDGDLGRHLTKNDKPFTKLARHEQQRLARFPIEFHVLERYGIENYFPRTALEKVLTLDLSSYFPIPSHVSVTQYLSVEYGTLRFQLRRVLAFLLRQNPPSPSHPLYSKSRNTEVAPLISLDGDLLGTDLRSIVMRATQRAKELATE
jgi:hypothetical protein